MEMDSSAGTKWRTAGAGGWKGVEGEEEEEEVEEEEEEAGVPETGSPSTGANLQFAFIIILFFWLSFL